MATKKPPADLIAAWEIIARLRQRVRNWGSEAFELRQRGEDSQAAVLEACVAELKADVDAWDHRAH